MAVTCTVPPAAAGLGIWGVVRTKGGVRRGRWAAVVAIVLGSAVTLILGVIVVLAIVEAATERDAEVPAAERDRTTIDRLRVGDCFQEVTAGPAAGVQVVPCTDPHQLEVFQILTVPGEKFPGKTSLERMAAQCVRGLEEYTGKQYRRSRLDFLYYPPSRSSWRVGDRTILCASIHPSGQNLIGSVRRPLRG